MKKYFKDIIFLLATLVKGLKLTFSHIYKSRNIYKPINVTSPEYFRQGTGIVTLQYPYQQIPLPDNARYKLHNEIDDCIVCDKCAIICPVNCIAIESIKSVEPIGYTSDGTVKRLYASKFDIDMAKCCYCGLCTTVCPTECLTMTKEYDFSMYDIRNMNYQFSDLTPELAAEKQNEYDMYAVQKSQLSTETPPAPVPAKPAFKPIFKKPNT
ncbi:MAG: 4Fe-4S dicluster domain-containing protein [Cytophagales bacterium]|nr:4Fe-4S dicluster domain-containing protein [Cytophagales bacterium]